MKIEKNENVRIELSKGNTLIFTKEEYGKIIEKLTMDITLKMLLDKPENVYLHKDFGSEKAKNLYDIVCDQKDFISPELRDYYLKSIVELIKGDFTEFKDFKTLMEDSGTIKKS